MWPSPRHVALAWLPPHVACARRRFSSVHALANFARGHVPVQSAGIGPGQMWGSHARLLPRSCGDRRTWTTEARCSVMRACLILMAGGSATGRIISIYLSR